MFGGMYKYRWRFKSQKMSMMPHEVISGSSLAVLLSLLLWNQTDLDIFDPKNKFKALLIYKTFLLFWGHSKITVH